jgi:hypothetical protein
MKRSERRLQMGTLHDRRRVMGTLHEKWEEQGKPGWGQAEEPARGIAKILYFLGALSALELLREANPAAVMLAIWVLEGECQETLLETARHVMDHVEPGDLFQALMRLEDEDQAG